jgi:hypothetical protein
MAAGGAPAVVQDPVVDDAAEDGADLGAQGTTAEAAEDDTDHGAEAAADRTSGHADREAGTGTSKCTDDAARGAGQAAEGAAGALGDVAGFDAIGAAVGTLKIGQDEEAPLRVSE